MDDLLLRYHDLAAERLGGRVLLCSDDFFAEKENLIKPGRGIFIPDKYTDRGKWMDGWESRRKRTSGHDWCIVQLATAGRIHVVDIDTHHFLGNHPPFASLDACRIDGAFPEDAGGLQWKEVLPRAPLDAGAQNLFEITDNNIYTHVRLNIFPDGGVARLKVYGKVEPEWDTTGKEELVDLAAAVNGAKAIHCNDMFFSHMDNLLLPGRGVNMGDGWETKRSRVPGNRDWVVIRLACAGIIEKALIDTCHFKGNYPDRFVLEGCVCDQASDENIPEMQWITVIPESRLNADAEHIFENEIENKGPFTHVRLTIIPDGGVSRMRLWGRVENG